jgi:hypothetical protein
MLDDNSNPDLAPMNEGVKKIDGETAQRIWADFRWQLKIKNMTYSDIQELLEKCAERARTEILNPNTREIVVTKFSQAAAKVSEFTVANPTQEAAKCPTCGLITFICVCQNQSN